MLVSTPASCINIYVDNKNNYCIFYCLCINKKNKKKMWSFLSRIERVLRLRIEENPHRRYMTSAGQKQKKGNG